MMEAALNLLTSSFEDGIRGETIKNIALEDKSETLTSPEIEALLSYMVKTGASDMLLTVGVPPSVKLSNEIKRLATVSLTPADCEQYSSHHPRTILVAGCRPRGQPLECTAGKTGYPGNPALPW